MLKSIATDEERYLSYTHCCRHAAREAEPKDYDVTDTNGKRNLLRATYSRIGSGDKVY